MRLLLLLMTMLNSQPIPAAEWAPLGLARVRPGPLPKSPLCGGGQVRPGPFLVRDHPCDPTEDHDGYYCRRLLSPVLLSPSSPVG
jgi:hypothetical protein